MKNSHAELGLELLDKLWRHVNSDNPEPIDLAFSQQVDRVFDGQETGYKKAIIIQAAGKAADDTLDAQAMQAGDGKDGKWDAREFAKKTFVIWNRKSGEPFSHTPDPYVSNPYRIPRFDRSQRDGRKRKEEFDFTLSVLERVNDASSRAEAENRLTDILHGLKRWIADKEVNYPLPQRVSLLATLDATNEFLKQKSGGTRLQAVVDALIRTLAATGLQISDISSSHINATDAGIGQAGDVNFNSETESFAIEVKDRRLTEDEFAASINKARENDIQNLMFVIRSKILLDPDFSDQNFRCSVESQFSSGLNIYLEAYHDFSRIALSLVGEIGRRMFLEEVGNSLASQGADRTHKWTWAEIVKGL